MNTAIRAITFFILSLFQIYAVAQDQVNKPDTLIIADQIEDRGISSLLEQIRISEQKQDTAALILATNTLLLRYAEMSHHSRAKELSNINLSRAKSYKDPCLLAKTWNYRGLMYSYKKEYNRHTNEAQGDFFNLIDSTLYCFKKTIEIKGLANCQKSQDGRAYAGLQRTYFFSARMSHKQFDTALYYGKKAMALALKSHDHTLTRSIHIWNARCYSHMKAYGKAKYHIKKAHELAIAYDEGFEGVYDVWFGVLTKESENDSLLWLHHEILKGIRNKAGLEMQTAIQDADRKFETEKKEQEIIQQQELIKRRDQILWVSIVSAIILGFFVIYLYSLSKKNKRLSQRNQLLLKEQNHRVKNNLQMINSLLSLQSQKLLSTDAKDALHESQGRINSVALLHRMLYEGNELGLIDIKHYLETLTNEIGYATPRTVTIQILVDEQLQIDIEKATSLGLIVNELVTNSLKHVEEHIELEIDLHVKRDHEQISVVYQDNGTAFDPKVWYSSNSFGHQLVQLQSEQLRGRFDVISRPGFQYSLQVTA